MGTPPLTPATEQRIALLFAPEHQATVQTILRDECGNNLPLLRSSDALAMDRVRFAALKLSGGSLDKLREAVQLARTDWRDLLVEAGFADDPNAHRSWLPARSW
jgi:hypothetical protein